MRVLGSQQHARARWLRYIVWWWWSHEQKLTRFRIGFTEALSCVLQHKSMEVREEPKEFGIGKGIGEMKDRDTGSILVDYQIEGTRDRVRLLIVQVEGEMYWDRLGIGDYIYGKEQSI